MVSDKVKDFWGVPVVVNTGERHPLDEKQCDFLSSKAENILKEAGAVQIWKHGGGRGMTGGQHQAGTCRMGECAVKTLQAAMFVTVKEMREGPS